MLGLVLDENRRFPVYIGDRGRWYHQLRHPFIAIQPLINQAIQSFDFTDPKKTVSHLLQIRRALKTMPKNYWADQKIKEVEKLIEQAGGLWMEASASVQNAVQGDSLKVNFVLNDRSGFPVVLRKLNFDGKDTLMNTPLRPNQNLFLSRTVFVSDQKSISQPYWLKEKMQEGMFLVNDQQLIGQADVSPSYTAAYDLIIERDTITYVKPVQYKFTDPVKGEVNQPLFVIPPMTVYAAPEVVVFQKGKPQSKEIELYVSSNKKITADSLEARVRSKYYALSEIDRAVPFQKGSSREYLFSVSNEKMSVHENDYVQPFADYAENGKAQYAYLATTSIHYDHIPTIRYFYSDGVKLLNIDLKTSGKKVGYIVGAGDKVPEALEQMGYEVTLLNDKELSRNHLQQFDAILTGVRAYNTDEWLNRHFEKLMKYVEGGGNLIVQYNTSSNAGPVRAKIGPYAFEISRNRITDENAAVHFLLPDHPVLNFPNRIRETDFTGWVQERSIYHVSPHPVRLTFGH